MSDVWKFRQAVPPRRSPPARGVAASPRCGVMRRALPMRHDPFDPGGETERVQRLVGSVACGRHGAQGQHPRIARERRLQESRQLGVAIRQVSTATAAPADVSALAPCPPGRIRPAGGTKATVGEGAAHRRRPLKRRGLSLWAGDDGAQRQERSVDVRALLALLLATGPVHALRARQIHELQRTETPTRLGHAVRAGVCAAEGRTTTAWRHADAGRGVGVGRLLAIHVHTQ
eukprot:scaffold22741_cov111-Isochrysis_galbana.AAC.2